MSDVQGIAKVYIDGVFKGYVDQYAHETEYGRTLYSISNLPLGRHSIAVGVTGRKNSDSKGFYTAIDAFDVSY